jgi:hypothetical protein
MGSVGWWIENPMPQEWRRTWAEIASHYAPWLTFVAFYAIFANLPYWIVAREFGFRSLGWFCVQYLTVGLIALIAPRILAAGLLFAVMIADLLCGICVTYSIPVRECLANLSAAHAFTGPRLLCVMIVGLLALLAAATAAQLPGNRLPKGQRWRAAACLVAFATAIVGIDSWSVRLATGHLPAFAHLSPRLDGADTQWLHAPRLARIPIIRLLRIEAYEAKFHAFDKSGPASAFPVSSATAAAMRDGGMFPGGSNGDLPNVVQILVESWGLAVDQPLQDALVEPYLQPDVSAKYEVIRGSVSFNGQTIAGEARELCGSAIGFHLLTAPAADLRSCLPARLAALGYETIGVHGMSGHMFNRSTWYDTIGFQERWFHEQLQPQGLPDCTGAFIGTCDADIAAWIGRRLDEDSSRPKFIHWMTLNSHLPEPVPLHLPNGALCSAALGLQPDSPLCSWYQLVANVHRSVAQLALDPMGRPTVFVIVGDHAPPFGDSSLHNRFSQSNVPYVVLVPRSAHSQSKTLLAHNAANPVSGSAQPPRQMP